MKDTVIRKADRFVAVVERISRISGHIAGVMLTGCFVIIIIGVVARDTGSPVIWSTQISNYMMLGTILFGLSYAMVSSDHIQTDLILNHLKESAKRRMLVVVRTIGLFWVAFFCIGCWTYFYRDMTRGAVDWGPVPAPLWIPELFLVLGSIFLFIQTVATIIGEGLGIRVPVEPFQEGGD